MKTLGTWARWYKMKWTDVRISMVTVKRMEDLSTRFAVRAEENLHFHFSLVSCGLVI